MKTLQQSVLAVALLATSLGVSAQAWPVRPVKVIFPFPPGQPFLVEHRAGGNGTIGTIDADLLAQGPGRPLHAAAPCFAPGHRAGEGHVGALTRRTSA